MRFGWMLLLFLEAPAFASTVDEPVPPTPAPAVEPSPVPASVTTAAAAAPELTLRASKSHVYALVYKKGSAAAFAHDHVIHAQAVTGTAVVDPANAEASRVSVTVSVSGLDPDSDAMREYVGLPRKLDAGARETILGHIQGELQLYLAKYSSITFRSTSVSHTGGDSWSVTGDFTVRGVTKRITVPMTITAEDGGWRAKGQFRINQTDYGYEPYYAMLGALQVEDYVDVVIDAYLSP